MSEDGDLPERDDWTIQYTLDIRTDGTLTVTTELTGTEVPDRVRLAPTDDVSNHEISSGGDALYHQGDSSAYSWDTNVTQTIAYSVEVGNRTVGGINSAVLADAVVFTASEFMPVAGWAGRRGRESLPQAHVVAFDPPDGWSVASPGIRRETNTYELYPRRMYVTQLRDVFAVGEFTVHSTTVEGTELRLAALPSSVPPDMDEYLSVLADTQPIIADAFGTEPTYPRLGLVVPRAVAGGPGGAARNNSFVVADTEGCPPSTCSVYDVETGYSVHVHEFVHTFHRFNNPDWQGEGQASWLDRLALYESGRISEAELGAMLRNRTDGNAEPKDVPASEAPHTKGRLIYAALDADIRARTEGEADIGSYISRVNDQRSDSERPPRIDRDEAVTALYDATGVDYTAFFERYVDTAAYPTEVLNDTFSISDPTTVAFAPLEYPAVSVDDEGLLPGDTLTVEIEVANVGESRGGRSLDLLVGGETVSSEQVTLDPGTTTSVTLEHEFDDSGEYDVFVSPVYRNSVTVAERTPSLTVDSIDISPTELPVGESVSLTATVRNDGTAAGSLPVSMTVDGEASDSATVELDVDESTTVTLEHSFEAAGTYELRLNGSTVGTVAVTPAQTTSPQPSPTETEPATTAEPTESGSQSGSGTPGFGVGATAGGIASLVGYLLSRTRGTEDE